ncbi:uncharacterized protein LOC132053792 [Lycium ferocissimum]|uniref:uncharacterized protein LOC132053792 n=1 Tax=Lycium ferocissimum TaxID=112874 RepID=UPI00281543DA|nr:uncharacterized protein LOC132053792 [Lycium ferocissimum]
MDVTKELPIEFEVVDPEGKLFTQYVSYDWRPLFCKSCLSFGHECKPEPKAPPKKPQEEAHTKKQVPQVRGGYKGNVNTNLQWIGKQQTTKEPANVDIGKAKQHKQNQTHQQKGKEKNEPANKQVTILSREPGTNATPKTTNITSSMSYAAVVQHGKPISFAMTRMEPKFASSVAVIARGWKHANNYSQAPNERIWLLWRGEDVSVTVQEVHAQYIHCQIKDRLSQFHCALTVVYGSNDSNERKALWDGLVRSVRIVTFPRCMCGDFNSPLNYEDRVGGQPVADQKVQDFRDVCHNLKLTDMKSTGRFLTWTNRHIWSKINRALCNPEWMIQRGIITAKFLENHFSDHSPIHMERVVTTETRSKPFRFLNVLAENDQFLQLVENC